MALITCPYCNMEISMSSVEAEDGYCPECGAVITASSIYTENDPDADESDLPDEIDEPEFDEDFDLDDEEIEDIDFGEENFDEDDDK